MTFYDTTSPYRRVFHHEEHVMGTVVTLDLFDVAEPLTSTLAPLIDEALHVLHVADAMFSTWSDESCVSRIRRGELSVDDAPHDVKTVLDLCREARSISRGWFDPWAMPGGVDPTGLVKGWAGQRALDVLRRADVGGATVNAAGDVASYGGPQAGAPFRVGIADPANPGRLACVVETPGAVATSGTYERGAHLIDPHSGRAATRAASATVVGPDLALADALATALVIAGAQGLRVIDESSDYEGMVIDDDGALRMTPGFPVATGPTTSYP
ncbi:MAG: FAD:protein FMN transferase [Acidimicrobiales bacterium]